MKFLLDCSTAKMGGAKTYLEEFLRAAGDLAGGGRWLMYGPPGCRSRLTSSSPQVELREAPVFCASAPGALYWMSRCLPRLALTEKADAVYAATGFGMGRPTRPQVLLVRNPIYFSDEYRRRTRHPWLLLDLSLRARLSLRAIRTSKTVVFPTQAMRDLVARYAGPQGTTWVVTPYGVSPGFGPGAADPASLPQPLRPISGQYLLNVSHYCAQKNFTVLLEALGILRRRGVSPPLALTTRIRPAPNCSFRADQEVIQREHLAGQVIELGSLPRESLPPLYRSARLFVFPSYLESFSHPLVEAMASGLPVLAADTPVNREVCAGAARYAAPFDPAEWADRILELLSDPALQRQLVEEGLSRAKQFSWPNHAAEIARLCEEAARSHA